jgi:hypothetical protein
MPIEATELEREGDILEEIILPERAGVLGSKSYRSINGKILKTTRLIFCDSCGTRLDENKPIVICRTCGSKLCSSHSCAFEFQRKHYCEEHMQQLLPLSVHGFEILRCILAEVPPIEGCEFAHMTHDRYRLALNELLEAGYIEKKGISLARSYKVLDRGILAHRTYASAYSNDGNVVHFESELINYLQERMMKKCR